MPAVEDPHRCDRTEASEPCFICLDTSGVTKRHCKCSMHSHLECLARWQLQRSGTAEETNCRFCHEALPDWKEALFTALKSPKKHKSRPTMAVKCGDQCHVIEVKPGHEGLAEFKREVKRLFGFGPEVEFDVSFSVPAPSFGRHQSATHHIGGQNLNLNGLSQFETAAAIAQAHRLEREMAATRMQHQERLAEAIPSRAPEQLTAAVARAAMEALAAEVQAAEAIVGAEQPAARAITAAAAMASLPAFHQLRFGSRRVRERERSPMHQGPNNIEGAGVPIPGLRVRTRAAPSSPLQQQDAAGHLGAGCKAASDTSSAVQARRMSSLG